MEVSMENKLSQKFTGSFFVGLALLALGTLFLLNNFDVIYVDHVGRYWPVILIAFGLVRLFESESTLQRGKGIWWIFISSWLLISFNGFFGLGFHSSWPILIVGWGISMLWRATRRTQIYEIAEEQHHGS
jgi:hypothetical protein